MNTIFRLSLGASLLAGFFVVALRGDSPPVKQAGQVLLLENLRVLEGDIEQEGDRYRLRRNAGESWVPANQVVKLCASMEDAYQYLRARANLRDVDERLKLARWCHLHGLKDQGLAEAKAALDIKPGNGEAQRLLRSLNRSLEAATATQEPEPKPVPETPPTPTLSVNLTGEMLTMYARRVQPILMNTCASCHVGEGQTGNFKLSRITEGLQDRRTTQQNLAAVMAQINVDNWPTSPLLVKALSVHGDTAQAPLKGRDAAAYKTLEEWVQQAAASAPQREIPVTVTPREVAPLADASTSRSQQVRFGEPDLRPAPRKSEADGWAVARPASAPAHAREDEAMPAERPAPADSKTKSETTKAEPADAFDPLIFNRQMHPDRDH